MHLKCDDEAQAFLAFVHLTLKPLEDDYLSVAFNKETLAAWIQRCKQSRLRRFFQSSLLRIPSDLRKCKTIKPLATIHFARQVLKRKTTRFGIHFGLFRASKPTRFCPRDKK